MLTTLSDAQLVRQIYRARWGIDRFSHDFSLLVRDSFGSASP
ncbi:hypothetical protein CKA32_000433 [Geitlerinema sp. FC II]|nr:hypothetical protein CKA32_000433 [Geitlerinema sp. FC II]